MRAALIVGPTFPYPIDGGNLVALHGYHVALRHAGYDEVHFLGFDEPGRSVKAQFEQCTLVPKPPKFSVGGLIRHALGSSLLLERYLSGAMVQALKAQIQAHEYEAVLFQHGYMAQYLQAVKHLLPAGCIKVSSPEVLESRAFRTKSQLASSALARMLMQREANILDRRETEAFNAFDRVAFFSEEDRQHYLGFGGTAEASVVNLGIEVDRYPFLPKAPPGDDGPVVIAFFGAFSWFANADALKYLLEDVWPAIRASHPRVILKIAGRGIPEDLMASKDERLEILGRVDSIEDFLRGVDIVLSPIRIGGGIRLKILESLAYGKPVISTTIGLEGLADEVAGLVTKADSPAEFAHAVTQFSNAPARLASSSASGAALVRQIYDARNLSALFGR
jgi:polysaccharide biosynthesis protein PslH